MCFFTAAYSLYLGKFRVDFYLSPFLLLISLTFLRTHFENYGLPLTPKNHVLNACLLRTALFPKQAIERRKVGWIKFNPDDDRPLGKGCALKTNKFSFFALKLISTNKSDLIHNDFQCLLGFSFETTRSQPLSCS
jgi:hypothetical protein